MKIKILTAAALIAAPVLLAFQPRATSIEFSIAEGTSKTKTFTHALEMELDDMSMLMNGQESPMTPDIQMSISGDFDATVTDEYLKMGDGSPAVLLRTYDSMEQTRSSEMEMDMMGQVQSSESSTGSKSELEGSTVKFTWNEDEGEYVASFPDGDGEEELLEGLEEDMDLRMLLPDGEVSEGDEWKLDPQALKSVLNPGGDLKLIPEESDDDDNMMGMNSDFGDADDWFTEDLDGEVMATFSGMRETSDGDKVAAIAITFAISNAIDMTEDMREEMENADLPPEAGEMEVNSMDIEIELEGECTLLWNVAEGYAHSFEMESDITFLVDINMGISAQGMDMEIEQSLEFSGSMNGSTTVGADE
jgi:hypothetical protein